MKRIIAVALVLCLCFGLCACSLSETKTEELLVGEWIWKEYPNNPIYMFLRFEENSDGGVGAVSYGTNILGNETLIGGGNALYEVVENTLEVCAPKATFLFKLQREGDVIRIFDDEGHEYVRSN